MGVKLDQNIPRVLQRHRCACLGMSNSTHTAGEQVSELITKKEVAKKLRVTTRTIDNLTNQGVITRIKLGSSSRYNWQQVLQSLESQSK